MKTSRDALLTTAFRLFLTKGYEQTSMQDLARESGLSKGAFHHYFPKKQDLLDACLDTFFRAYLPGAGEGDMKDITRVARDAASKYAQALQLMVEHEIPLAAYQAFLWSQVRDAPQQFLAYQTAFLKQLTKGFEAAGHTGADLQARKLFTLIEGTGVLLSIDPPAATDEFSRAFDLALDDFFACLGSQP